jgi:hypothetical protein
MAYYFDFYTCDAIALKPLKGPSIVVLEEGTIKQKFITTTSKI